jgi:hypothetical protein
MALTVENIADLEQYKTLSTHLVGILDNESKIDSVVRQLSATNITGLNSLYTDVIARINEIIDLQAPLP